ncbi:FUN14 domain-containing protein 1B-like protein [Euroglyphus maynei]|uniref:FUN14 domain-containing protein 1B-like protein n=1 Tax=Euroglyphus maynei TaxID=6958 RepID=A0A1Y3AZQ3_EURMA|nr:FUN14 domain-containing protein 1B-like protein [Euroglyphus maynei]
MIDQFDMIYANRTGVPSKLLFWFDYGTLQSIPTETIQNRRYERLYRRLIFNTRNFGFYSLATNTTTLNDVISDKSHLIQINKNSNNDLNLMKNLQQQLCQSSPQIFQYPECKIKQSENSVYRGFISPNYKQYWAMYSEYFLKSFHIELRFRAEESLMKVCFDRAAFPENNENNCKVNNDPKEDIVLNVKNPCKGLNTDNCPPLFFTISLYNPPASHKFCTEKSNSDKNIANGNDDGNVPEIFKRFFYDLKKSSNSKQLMAGAMGGVVSGYLAAKFGKLAAIAVGGSMLVIQIAQYNGYIEIDWKKVNQDVQVVKKTMDKNKSQLPAVAQNVRTFVAENAVLAGGFASGFLIGFAWA